MTIMRYFNYNKSLLSRITVLLLLTKTIQIVSSNQNKIQILDENLKKVRKLEMIRNE